MDNFDIDQLDAYMLQAQASAVASAPAVALASARQAADTANRRAARRAALDDREEDRAEEDDPNDHTVVVTADEQREEEEYEAAQPLPDLVPEDVPEDVDDPLDPSSGSDDEAFDPEEARQAAWELGRYRRRDEPQQDVRWNHLVNLILATLAPQLHVPRQSRRGSCGVVLVFLLHHRALFAGGECDGKGPTVCQKYDSDRGNYRLRTSSRSHTGREFFCGMWRNPEHGRRIKDLANQLPVAIVALECVHLVMWDAAKRMREGTAMAVENVAESVTNALAHRACRMHVVAPAGFRLMAELALYGVGQPKDAFPAVANLVAANYQGALERIEVERLCASPRLMSLGRLAVRALGLTRSELFALSRKQLLELPVPFVPSPSSYLFGYTHVVCAALCASGQGRQELEDWEALHQHVSYTQIRRPVVRFFIKSIGVTVGTLPSLQAANDVQRLLECPDNGLYRVFIYAWKLMSSADWDSADAQADAIARSEYTYQFHMPDVAVKALAALRYNPGTTEHAAVVAGVVARRCDDDARVAAAVTRTSYAHGKRMTPEQIAKLKERNDALFAANVWGG